VGAREHALADAFSAASVLDEGRNSGRRPAIAFRAECAWSGGVGQDGVVKAAAATDPVEAASSLGLTK